MNSHRVERTVVDGIERDAFFPVGPQQRSAEHYGADFVVVENEGHNLMIERSWRTTAETVPDWLSARID